MLFGPKCQVIFTLLLTVIATSIVIEAKHGHVRSTPSPSKTPTRPIKTTKKPDEKNNGTASIDSELCGDEKSCDEERTYYEEFISLLSVKAPETLKMYILAVNSISKALNKTQGGREFIEMFKLPEHRPAEVLVAMHKSNIQNECDMKRCACPLDTYLCKESLVCSAISVDPKECASKPKCGPNCKLITLPTNGHGSKSERTVKLARAKGIVDQMIDALGAEVNKVVNQVVLAAFQAHSLQPVCEALEEGGKCVEGSGRSRSVGCWFSGCADDDDTNRHKAEMERLKLERLKLDIRRQEMKLEHDRAMEEIATKERASQREAQKTERELELDAVKLAVGQSSIDVKAASSSSTAKPAPEADSESTEKPASRTTAKPDSKSASRKQDAKATHNAIDPKDIYVMRETFKILKDIPDLFARSIKCPCKKEVCEANQKLWKCSNFCPNNHGCDTYKCECPYEKSAIKTTAKP